MEILNRAAQLHGETVAHRRYLHENAETGLHLPLTVAYVEEQLRQCGCEPVRCANGVTALIGDAAAEKVLLLRADMDALPMAENSGLPFASKKSDAAHCCGHDLHASMLLTAAKILKERESELGGAVRVMFQPGEEVGAGCEEMVNAGILNDPPVTAAMGLHVDALAPLGQINYGKGSTFASNDCFDITVCGKSGHGARPWEAIDPIRIGALFCGAVQCINRVDVPQENKRVLTITSFHGGSTYNIIPETAEMKASLRCYTDEDRAQALQMLQDAASRIEEETGATIRIETESHTPCVICDGEFVDQCLVWLGEDTPQSSIAKTKTVKGGSEDFAFLSQQQKKSAYLFIGAGKDARSGYQYGQHNTNVIFNEDALMYGVSMLVKCAEGYLGRK